MGRVSSGFPELDKILEAGIPRPSLISVRGEFGTVQRELLFQIIQNFLKKGLNGLYVCVDRPENEVKDQIAKFGIDFQAYYEKYNLYFLDFFSESTKVLLGDSKKISLKFTADEVYATLNPFLDWIKNGFMVIDSASSLIFNTDAKGVYDFVRGAKLIGRLFNLIIIGIYQMPITDKEGFDQVYTNSDGHFLLTEDKVTIENFENIHNNHLLVSRDPAGKLLLTSPIPMGVNEETGINALAILSKSGSLKIEPLLTLKVIPQTKDSIADLIPALVKMEEAKILKSKPYCTSISC